MRTKQPHRDATVRLIFFKGLIYHAGNFTVRLLEVPYAFLRSLFKVTVFVRPMKSDRSQQKAADSHQCETEHC